MKQRCAVSVGHLNSTWGFQLRRGVSAYS